MPFDKPTRYCAYVLRCWNEQPPCRAYPLHWRFSLEDPHTGARYGFADLDALVTWLQTELNGSAEEVATTHSS